MRILLAVALAIATTPAFAADAPPPAPATTVELYTTAETPIGTLLDDAAAKAIIEKHVPGMTTGSQIDMARAMTLKDVQQYAADQITDDVLKAIDADLAALAKK